MSARQRFAIDNTVLVHFASTEAEAANDVHIANAKAWFKKVISDTYIDLVSSPTVLIELARHLYFKKRFNHRKVRQLVSTLHRSYLNFTVPDQGTYEVTELLPRLRENRH